MLAVKNIALSQRIDDVSLSAEAGQAIHVLGSNGAGKSSLLHVIAGLIPPDDGEIKLHDRNLNQFTLGELSEFRCLQTQQLWTAFDLTVREALAFSDAHSGLADELEQALEIRQFLDKNVNTLSGGESRRVHLAKTFLQVWHAIEQGRAMILLDEPNQGLDFRHQHLLFGLLDSLRKKGNLIIVSHHDLNTAYHYASHVWFMKDGRCVSNGTARECMTKDTLESVFDCHVSVTKMSENGVIFQTCLDKNEISSGN